MKNPERIDQIRSALRENHWDLLVCALPMNVLLLSGYWPVIGTGVAIAFADGHVSLLVPEDEGDLAKHGWADDVRTFKAGSLDELTTPAKAIHSPLRKLAESSLAAPVRVGFEAQETSEPASYAAMHLYNGTMRTLLEEAIAIATIIPADAALARLRARKTTVEIEQIRTACRVAERAFVRGFEQIDSGASEVEIAATFRQPLSAVWWIFPR